MRKAILVLVLILVLAGLALATSRREAGPFAPGVQQKPGEAMTFSVTIPANTLPGDTVQLYAQKGYEMARTGNRTFSVTLPRAELSPNEDGTIRYRYTRNGYDFHTAEFLEPDTNDYFWTQRGRSTTFRAGAVQNDTIARWRWFPPDGTPIVRTTALEPAGTFLPRERGLFRSGQIIEDLYVPAFHPFLNSTAAHLAAAGYTWVELDPPLQWAEADGLPKVVNRINDSPNYPDDQALIDEITAYKQHGLKVMLGPQLCCTELSTQNRSKEWWDAYFRETTAFLTHMAEVGESAHADAIHYAVGHDYGEPDYAERWSSVFREVRKHFSGEVGEMLWNFGSEPGAIIPDADYITWGAELDYFYIAIDTPISLEDAPTDADLEAGAARMLDGAEQLHKRYGKPIFVRTTYFSVKQTWKGNSFYSIGSVPWISSEERELAEGPYALGTEDLARVVNAYFRAIAARPWVIGYAQFGYSHWENPLVPALSVRGKPAEDLWSKWNAKIYGNATAATS